jgi:hypothetical protein
MLVVFLLMCWCGGYVDGVGVDGVGDDIIVGEIWF